MEVEDISPELAREFVQILPRNPLCLGLEKIAQQKVMISLRKPGIKYKSEI